MPLVPSSRPTEEDLRVWATLEAYDARLAWTPLMERRIESAIGHLADFASRGPCYAGVSWGKDSVAVAGLIAQSGLDIPLVWVRVEPKENPDCPLVRDAFFARFPWVRYEEVKTYCTRKPNGTWSARGTLERGFAEVVKTWGDRHISGIRGQESATRQLREARFGVATERTCAPITRWSGVDVFAYLHRAGLPVHPAYACSQGGLLERDRLRVSAIGGERGTGMGRREWEWAYYRDALVAIGEDLRVLR